MKKEFFAFIRPTDDELKAVWNECIFTFDANILLNFYRYTAETTSTFFQILERIDDRIFLTYQAANEYFDNRLDVISEQERAYSEVRDSVQKNVEDILQNPRKHPYISPSLLADFLDVCKKVKSELTERSKEYSQKVSNDDILKRIIDVFDTKVGKPFSEVKLNEIYQEGDKRYNENIPPGFKDKAKGGTRQYGDLVLWFQMIEFSKEQDKDLVFITDDEKEDWLYIHKGRTISPLPELQNEFCGLTGKKIYIYTAHRFIEIASQFFNTDITEETIEEIRTFQEEVNAVDAEEPQLEETPKALKDEDINEFLSNAIRRIENEQGWAELASLGVYLIRHTPIDYRKFGYLSLRRFIESRSIFETKVLQKSPNARAVDTAFVRIKPLH